MDSKAGVVLACLFLSLSLTLSNCSTSQDDSSSSDGNDLNIHFCEQTGFFQTDDRRVLLLGAEEPPIWIAFEELRPYPEVVDEFIGLCRQSNINLIVLYRYAPWPKEFLQRLADADIWLGIQVAEVKENLFGFPQTGGAWGTLPSQEFIDEQMESINRMVSTYSYLPNIAFWWLGGEFVEPVFRADGGARLREIVQLYASEIRSLDPQNRPITCSRHMLEYWAMNPFGGVTPIDLSDITDFTWVTIATHMHLGDFIGNLPEELVWRPVLDSMEHPDTLRDILQTAWELNGGKPLYLGSWSTKAAGEGPCTWSYDRTLNQWRTAFNSVPALGGAYWHMGSHTQPSDEPHALFYLGPDSKLEATDNLFGLAQGYKESLEAASTARRP